MAVNIEDIPVSERPRERLIHYGVESLGNDELLAILLRCGTKDMSVKELSNYILKELSSIRDMKQMNYEKLVRIKGIGPAKACQVLAAIELGNRLSKKYDCVQEIKIANAEEIYFYYKELLKDKKQEYFYCVYLDTRNKIIKDKLLFMGTLNQSLVHPREVFKEAYLCSASSMICVHNHPAGSSEPSRLDITLTEQLGEAGKLLGIPLLDHIIIGNQQYFSFMEAGMI